MDPTSRVPLERSSISPKRYSLVLHEPRVGQGTFKCWLPPTTLSLPSPPSPSVPVYLCYPSRPPPNSLGRVPPSNEAPYTGYVRHSSATIVLACNTNWFPPPPSQGRPYIFEDGNWGLFEYTLVPQVFDRHAPWLSYIPLQHTQFRPNLHHDRRNDFWSYIVREVKRDGELIPYTTNLQTWKSSEEEESLVQTSFSLISQVEIIMSRVLSIRNHLNRDVEDGDLPRQIIQRVKEILGQIHYGVVGWKEFLLNVRSLFRALLELTAFVTWASDVRSYPNLGQRNPLVVRGAIFETFDFDLFLAFTNIGLPMYLRVETRHPPSSLSSRPPQLHTV